VVSAAVLELVSTRWIAQNTTAVVVFTADA